MDPLPVSPAALDRAALLYGVGVTLALGVLTRLAALLYARFLVARRGWWIAGYAAGVQAERSETRAAVG